MILQVHDELVFDVKKSELDRLKVLVADKMSSAIRSNALKSIPEGNLCL